MKKILLRIDGMTCSACSNGLEKYLNKQNGIHEASVNLIMSNALIQYDEKILDKEKIERYVEQAGFKSLGIFNDKEELKNNKNKKIFFILFTVLAIVLMYISMGAMIGLPIPQQLDVSINPILYAIVLLSLTIPFLIYGFDILKNGYKNLIHGSPNMDTLVAIGVLSSFIYSLFNMFLVINGKNEAVHDLYFESSAIVIYFIKLGRYIDGKSKDKTKEAIKKLVQITPKNALIKVDGKEKNVTIDEIKHGDIVVSKSGEKISVDGEIIYGKTHTDESFITGESRPVSKNIGDKVIAGSINYDGYIEYKAEKIGRESTISEIVRLVVEATNTKAPIARIADRVSGYFVPAVILIAILTFVFYLIKGNPFGEALSTFVTILVIACPCSLGLATPLAIVVSEGICAKKGILVKKSEILENARNVDTVIFDKTGTLTYGKLKIAKIMNYSNIDNEELIQLVGTLENKSTHPIAKAFTGYLKEKNIEQLEVEEFENISGYGIIGKINNDRFILGNRKIIEKNNIENIYHDDEKTLSEAGNSVIYVAKNNKIIAMIGVNDIIRENVKEIIEKFSNSNIETIMLTGDNAKVAKNIANKIGIKKVIAEVVPEEKAKLVKKLKNEGRFILMCGDGINDSPALANSNIGVSVNSGTDIAMDSSDVILMNNDLKNILELINISKKTIRNIKQNLFWAFFYNVLMIPIAIGILKPIGITINPMIASLSMTFSSFTVILNALRLKTLTK